MVIDKLLETLIGNVRGFELFENPSKKELSEITSFVKRDEVRAIYNIDNGKLFVWEMGVVHGYVIRDYFADVDHNGLIKMIIKFNAGKINFVDTNKQKQKMFFDAREDSEYLQSILPQSKFHINETLLKRDKYTTKEIDDDEFAAQNKEHMSFLKNKVTSKEYVEKGYRINSVFDRRLNHDIIAGFEYIGYYVAHRIIEDYKLEGFTVPKVKGLTVVNNRLKLLMDRAKGKSLQRFGASSNYGNTETTKRNSLMDKVNMIAYPLFDLIGHFDSHEGNVVLSTSGKINFIDFEGAFTNTENITVNFLKNVVNNYKYENIKKFEKRVFEKFFKNLLRLRYVNESTIFMYVEEAINEVYNALKNEKFDRDNVKKKLEFMFNNGDESEHISKNVKHVKNMAEWLKKILQEQDIGLEEAVKFSPKKFKVTSDIGEFEKGYEPLNISNIKKVKNKRNQKLYIRKGYSYSFFNKDVAGVFEYAAYRALKEVKKTTNQSVRIPRLFALNLNNKTGAFELLTSIDYKNSQTVDQVLTGDSDVFINNNIVPILPILILIGHFDIHGGNIIVGKTGYYLIDFERAFINTLDNSYKGGAYHTFKEMEKEYFNLIYRDIDKFYDKKYTTLVRKRQIIKLIKNINSLNIKDAAITVYQSLEKTEKYALKLIEREPINDDRKNFLREHITKEMKKIRMSINDNYKYLENYLAKLKSLPNFQRILGDANKIKGQYETHLRTGIGETPKIP